VEEALPGLIACDDSPTAIKKGVATMALTLKHPLIELNGQLHRIAESLQKHVDRSHSKAHEKLTPSEDVNTTLAIAGFSILLILLLLIFPYAVDGFEKLSQQMVVLMRQMCRI
jgi:hypothetical protein